MLIHTLLRILTPEEINDLITTGTGQNRVSLIDIMSEEVLSLQDEEESEAKILPFKKREEGDEEAELPSELIESSETNGLENFQLGEKCLKYLSKIQSDHHKNLKDVFATKRKKKKIKDTKETSLFILEEKKKLEHATVAMKGKEIIQLYEKNSKVDVNLYRNNRENLHKSSQMGVLVNKKQA